MAQYGAAATSSKNIWDLDPRNVGGCVLWLDGTDANTMFADAGTTLAAMGGTVYRWKDKSLSANDGIMATVGARPTRVTDTGYSGLPTLNFSGSQWFGLDITKLPTGQANSTMFAVFRHIPPNSTTQNNVVFSYGGPILDNGGTHRAITAATSGLITMEDGITAVYQGVSSVTTSCGVLMFQDFTMSGWINGSAAINSPYDLEKEPGFATTGTGTTAAWVGYPQKQGGGRNQFLGNIHEILVFNRGLGNSERQQIEGYLAWKWGFVSRLPTSHPYFSSTISKQEISTLTSASLPPGPNLWLDTSIADNILLYPVIQWYDKSGQNNHAVALSNLAYVKYTSGQFLTGNSSTGRLQILNPSDPFLNTTFTFFIVELRGSGKSGNGVFGSSDNSVSNTGFYACYFFNSNIEFGFFGNRITYTVPAYNANETYRIWTFAFKGNGSGIQLWLNGTSVASSAGTTQSTAVNAWSLFNSPHLTSFFDGNIREVLSYKTQLNTTDQQNVEGYLAWKWGLQANLPVGHPSKSAAPSGFVPNTSITTSGATCRLWFDAADTTAVTQPLTRWLDKSGNNNHADARLGAGSSGNAMRTDALVNSRRLGVGGNGATSRLQLTDVSTPFVNTTFTIFFVERRGSSKANNFIFGGTAGVANTNLHIAYITNTLFRFAFYANDLDYTLPSGFTNTEPYRIWTLVFKAGSGGKEIWLNGALVASNATQTANLASNVGWSLFNCVTFLGDGHTREIISYKTFLNTTDQQNVEGYLAWKWGLQANLPIAHMWSTTISPGGYTGSYAPPNTSITTSDATCQLWFDGNDTASMAETEFHIRDRSGNNRHAAGITGTLTYTTGAQNGLNAIDFTPSARLFTPSFIIASNSRLTLFVVLKQTSASISSTFDMFYGTPRTNLAMYLNTSGNHGTIVNTTPDSLTTFASSQNALAIYRVTININGTAVNSLLWSRQYVNGTFYSTFSNASLGTALSASQTWNLLNGGMSGTLYEVLSYANELSEFQSRLVEGYLAWKWGVQSILDANHPYDAPNYLMDRTRPFARNFVPNDIEGCQLWIDPADASTVTTIGSNVTSIADKSGLGNNVTNIASTIAYTDTLNGRNVITSATGTAFNPTSISGCALWLDAADSSTLTLSGSNVTQWRDKSGNGNNATSGVNPTYNSSSKSLSFTGTQYMTCPNFAYRPINMYVVVNITAPYTTTGNIIRKGFATGTDYEFGLRTTSSNVVQLELRSSGAQSLNLNNTSTYGNLSLFSISYDNTTCSFFVNGTSTNSGTLTGPQFSGSTNLFIGCVQGLSDFFKGDISEVVIFNSALTTIQRQAVEGYLAYKWGLQASLPSSHPYAGGPTLSTPVPTNYSGISLWLDAADSSTLTLSGSNVTQWRDKSGNSRNATQVTAGNRPTYTSNGVVFTASSSTFLDINVPFSTSHSVFLVARSTSGTNNYYYGRNVAGAGPTIIQYFTGTSIEYFDIGERATFVTSPPTTSPFMLNFVRSFGSNVTGFYLGSSAFSISQTYSLNTTQPWIYIGRSNATDYLNATIFEFMIFNSALSTTQRQDIEGYLALKWGLQTSLPTTHPYYINYPTTRVANRLYTSYIPRNPVNHSFFYVLKYPASVTSGAIPLYYGNSYFGHTGTTAPLLEDNNVITGGVTASSPYGSYASATAFYGGNTFVCASVRQNEKITLTTNGRSYGTTGGNALGNETIGQYSIQLATGQLAELIVYNSALSEGDRQMVEGYLMWKWGVRTGVAVNPNVTIPTTHSYYTNPPMGVTPDLPGLQLYRTSESVLGDLQPTLWLDPQDPTTYGVDANNRVQYIFNKRNLITSSPISVVSNTSDLANGSTYNTGLTGTPIFINQPLKMFGTISATSGTGILDNTVYYAAHIYTVNSVAADGFTLNIGVTSGSSVAITTNRYVVFNADIAGTTPIKAGQLYFARTITGAGPTTAFTVSATSGGANITGLTPGTLTGVRGTHAGLMRFSLAPNDTPITTLNRTISGAYLNLCDTTTGISGTGININGPLLTQSAIGTGAGLNYFDFSTGGSFPITSASVGGGGTVLTLVVGAKSVLITTGTITSNIATVGFIDPGYVLFAQGQRITISGSSSTSTSFNGTFTIISCTQTSVTFGLTGSGTVTGGTISVFLAHNIPTTRQITLTISSGLYFDTTSATALTGTYTTQSGTTENMVVLTIPSSPVGSLTGLVGRVDYGNILLTNIQMTSNSSTATFTTSGNHNLVATTDAIFLSLPDTTVTGFASTTGTLNRANGQYTVASTPTATTFTVALTELGGSAITPSVSINQTLVSNKKPAFAYFPINGYCLDNRLANYILPGSQGLNTIIAVTHLNPGPGTVISSQAARSGRDNATQTPIVSTSFTLDGNGGSDLNNINGVGAASSIGIGRDFNTRLSNFGSNGIQGSIRRCQSNGAGVSPTDTSVITNTTNGFRIMTHTFVNNSNGSADITTQSQSTAFGGWRNITTLSPIQYNSDYYGYSTGSAFNFSGIRVIAGSTVGTTGTLTLIQFGWEAGTNPFHVGQLVSVVANTPVSGYNLTNVAVTAVTPTTVSYTVASGTANFTGGSGIITRTSANNITTNINHLRIGADTSATKTYTSSFLTDNFFDGGVGDILVFNGALSLEQRQFVEGYLAQKYRFQQFLGTSTNQYDQDNGSYPGLSFAITSATCANVGSIPIPTVTLTFTNPRTTNPIVLASTITVANITTTGYNGTFFVTGYSTQSPWTVSYPVSSLLTTPAVLGTLPTVKTNVTSTNLMVHPYKSSPAVIDGRLNLSVVNAQNLITWFDASNRSTMGLCGSRVCEWQSSGGTQVSLYEPFPQLQPLYVPNALNGLPGVRFMLPGITGGTITNITSGGVVRIIFPAGLVPTIFKAFIPSVGIGGLFGGSVYFIRSITFISGTTYDVTCSFGQILGGVITSITAGSGSVACSFYDIGLLYSSTISGITTTDSISTRTLNMEFTYVMVLSRGGFDGYILHFGGGNNRIIITPTSVGLINAGLNVQQVFTFSTVPTFGTPYILVASRRRNVFSVRLIGNNGYVTQTSTAFGDLRIDPGNPGLQIGTYGATNDTGVPFSGDIYETVLFRTALSEQALQVVEGYLAWKWGFVSSLPSTHAYKKIRP